MNKLIITIVAYVASLQVAYANNPVTDYIQAGNEAQDITGLSNTDNFISEALISF